MLDHLPLAEKVVVITRPREQAVDLQAALEQLGAEVILFPTIEIVEPESYAELDAAIRDLSNYDWLVLTSVNAAEHFLRRLAFNNLEIFELDYLRLCVVGEATAERMRLAQAHIDVLPTDARAEGIFAALSEYLGGFEAFENLRFLLPRSSIGRDYLLTKLREAGATVNAVTAYQTVLPRKNLESARLKTLLQSSSIDCITFTSPSTFKNFVQIFADSDLRQLLGNVAIACIGETTAQTVRTSNFNVNIVASEPLSKAFAQAIASYFQSL